MKSPRNPDQTDDSGESLRPPRHLPNSPATSALSSNTNKSRSGGAKARHVGRQIARKGNSADQSGDRREHNRKDVKGISPTKSKESAKEEDGSVSPRSQSVSSSSSDDSSERPGAIRVGSTAGYSQEYFAEIDDDIADEGGSSMDNVPRTSELDSTTAVQAKHVLDEEATLAPEQLRAQRLAKAIEELRHDAVEAEEVKESGQLVETWFLGLPKWCEIIFYCQLFLLGVTIILTYALRKHLAPLPVVPPKPAFNVTRFNEFVTLFSNLSDEDTTAGTSVLSDPNTAQYAALRWLSNEDRSMIDPTESNLFPLLIERYALFIFYYRTTLRFKSPWIPRSYGGYYYTNNWISRYHVCDWEGVLCHDSSNSTVTELHLGECRIKPLSLRSPQS